MTIHERNVDYQKDKELIDQLRALWRWRDWPKKAHVTYVNGSKPLIISGHDYNDWSIAEYPSLMSFLSKNNLDTTISKVALGLVVYQESISQHKCPQCLIDSCQDFSHIDFWDTFLSETNGMLV